MVDDSLCENLRWFHVVLTMYGAWLPGDRRGFRTRHHRRHVEGDYKNPPPPLADSGLREHARRIMKERPAVLTVEDRMTVGRAIVDRLEDLGAVTACVATARKHVHVLAKMPADQTRQWIGHAKRHAWFVMRPTGRFPKLWASGAKFVPIHGRQHQLNVYHYIVRHEQEGAWIWRYSDRPRA